MPERREGPDATRLPKADIGPLGEAPSIQDIRPVPRTCRPLCSRLSVL